MVVHRGKGWAYIAIPKTGSTSLTRMLQMPQFGGEYTGRQHDTRLPGGAWKLVFATVRNPFTRAVSMYTHFLNEGTGKRIDFADLSFERFCREQLIERRHADPFFHATIGYWIDAVGREVTPVKLENIQDDLTALKINRGRFPVIRINESRHKPWRTYYTPEVETLVLEWAAKDFDRFGYSTAIGAR